MKPAIIVTVLVVLFVAAFLFFRVIIAPYILEAHTGIMFTQIRERIEAAENFPISTKSLIAIIENSNIDWNSCRIEDEEILDGWENPIRIEFIEAERTLSFQSSRVFLRDRLNIIDNCAELAFALCSCEHGG